MTHPTICLNMIVKNESHLIERCLESVKNVIDYWIIADTGSTDGTQQIIENYFSKQGVKGELHEHQWENFEHNRTLALKATKGKADYILMMDADDVFIYDGDFSFGKLKEDSYYIRCVLNGYAYSRQKLIKATLPWYWQGVLHEVLKCRVATKIVHYPDTCSIKTSTEGARGKNPDKYKEDAEILEKALQESPDNTRYQFYLAQSYRDMGDFKKSLECYQKRVGMRGWNEEVYISLHEIARNQRRLNKSRSVVLESLLKAYSFRPSRLEALCDAVIMCRLEGNYHLGYHLGISAIDQPMTNDVLFTDKSVYLWRLKDEVAVCASWIGRKNETKHMIAQLLQIETLPTTHRERITANLAYC